ncbi:MAG: MGMT family protein [Lachnospiraceae bacterium]
MKVWASLSKIPYGEVRTYKDIAENIQIKVQLLALEGREYKDKCEEVRMA